MSIMDLSSAPSASSRKPVVVERLPRKTSVFWTAMCRLVCLLLCAPAVMRSQSLQYVPVISNYVADPGACSTATDTFGDGCPLSQLPATANAGGDVFDNAGNLYFTDTTSGHKLVRRVDAVTGIVTLVAGGGPVCAAKTDSVGDGCPATQATFTNPAVLIFDPYGNLVIGDISGYRVRRIDKTTGIITTIAGTGVIATAVPNNTTPALATATPLAQVNGLAYDRAGNLYIGNYLFSFIAVVPAINGVITPASVMYNVAGNGTVGATGDGGPPTAAEIGSVRGLAMDPAGNLYAGDWNSYKDRKITPVFQNGVFTPTNSVITTIAGTGAKDASPYGGGNGGLATAATIHQQVGIAVDSTGLLYLNQYTGNVIRTVNLTTGIINAFAGYGTTTAVPSTLNSPAATSGLDAEQFINFNQYHDLFTGETGGTTVIAKISTDGDFLLTQPVAAATGVSQTIIAQATAATTLNAASVSGQSSSAPEFSLGTLSGCTISAALAANAYCTIPVTFKPAFPGLRTARLTVQDANSANVSLGLSGIGTAPNVAFSLGTISTITGTGAAGKGAGQVSGPRGGAVDGAGNLYFADTGNNVIRRVDTSGTVTTVVGTGTAGYTGDGAVATAATLNVPAKVALDAAGNLYIADSGNNVIRFVNVDTGLISTIAGTGTAGYSGDASAATAAKLNNPQGLAVDRGGNVYVADTGNNAIRLFTPGSWIVTIAGTGTAGDTGDSGPASMATLNKPQAVTLDNLGKVYIADTGNAVIRQISALNQISTVAGTAGGTSNSGDGGAATAASLLSPSDVAVDAAGNMYISTGGLVRQVSVATQIINTIAGTGAAGNYSGEGGAATSAVIPSPASNLILDASANVYVADTAGNLLLKVSAATAPSINFGIVPPGQTGTTTTFSILNTGNATLNLSGLTATTNFTLQTAGTSACMATTMLTPGQACTIGIAFTPSSNVNGAVTGTLTITDNALNGTSATQVLALSGSTIVVKNTMTTITTSPTSPVYGSPVMITATVTNGSISTPTGNVTFTVNGTASPAEPLNGNGQYTITIASLPAGTTKVVASYGGNTMNDSSTGNANVVVQPAVLTVTAANATMKQGLAVPSFTYSVTGYINGDTGSVVSGAPSEITAATSSSPQGTYPIVISAGTLAAQNYSFTFVNGTLTIGPPPPADFSLGITPTTQIVSAGSTSTLVTLIMTPIYGYAGTPQITCSSVPQGIGCTPTGPLTGSGTITVAYSQLKLFAGTSTANLDMAPLKSQRLWLAICMPLCFLGLAFGKPGKKRWSGKLLGLLLLAMAAAGMSSCSSASSSSHGIAAGTYQITVTAADSAANLSHKVTFALIAQ